MLSASSAILVNVCGYVSVSTNTAGSYSSMIHARVFGGGALQTVAAIAHGLALIESERSLPNTDLVSKLIQEGVYGDAVQRGLILAII